MEASASSDNDQDPCVICLSPISERASVVPCNHQSFDFICLVSWLQQRSTCPLCKAEVTAVQYDWHAPNEFKSYRVRRTHPRQDDLSSPHSRALLSGRRRPHHLNDQPQPDLAVIRRRHVYRYRLYSFHVGSNLLSGYRDVASDMVANSTELQSKARMWIRRELRVFTFLHADPDGSPYEGPTTSSNAEFLLSYIVAILKKVDLKASNGHAEDLLQEFLGRENARLFLHELSAWMRSPYTKLGEWDQNVQYGEELPKTV